MLVSLRLLGCVSAQRNASISIVFFSDTGAPVLVFIVKFRINRTLRTGSVRKPNLPGGGKCLFIFRFHYKRTVIMSNTLRREEILALHAEQEAARADEDKLWTGLWHATISQDFIVVASQEKFNGSVWAVYAYITSRMDLASGKSRRLKNSEICEALGISQSTLDRAKAILKEFLFIEENDLDGSVYYAKDVAEATARARLRQVQKRKQERREKHDTFIREEEARLGHHLSLNKRTALIKEKFGEKYQPLDF